LQLRISLEGENYQVDLEILPETAAGAAGIDSDFAVPAGVLRPPPRPDIRPEDRILRSPIAGVLVSVSCAIGQKVRQDDPVLVIEAMKMESTIGAPVEGTVDAVHVVPGQLVTPGQPLCTLV
jgi:biotin carboxyl carrier protein